MTIEVLDPTYGDAAQSFTAAERPENLAGQTIGLLSNGKQGTRLFFDAFEASLRRDHGIAEVVRVTKSNYSAPADVEIMDQAKQWHALVAGIGD